VAVGITVAALAAAGCALPLWRASREIQQLRTLAAAEDRFVTMVEAESPQEAVAAAVEVLVPQGRLVAVHLGEELPAAGGLSGVLVADAQATGLPAVLPDGTTGHETARRVALPIAVGGRRAGAVVLRLREGSDEGMADVQRLLRRVGPLLATAADAPPSSSSSSPPPQPAPAAPSAPPPAPVTPATSAPDSDRDLRELVARGAHDLRTPLNTLAGMVDTLVRHGDELPPATREELHEALQRSTRRVAGWITMLLDAAVGEGARSTNHVPTPLQALLDEAVTVTQAATTGLRVEVPNTDLYVFADPGSVVRVVSNLLANAGHHGGGGGSVEVEARARGRDVEVNVSDHGAGWDPAAPGEGSENETHRSGLGLGLESVRAQVAGWGGELVLEETPGGGATVRFTLPRAQAGIGDRTTDATDVTHVTDAGEHGGSRDRGAATDQNWTIAGRESLLRSMHRTP